jgi:hypothetical protein
MYAITIEKEDLDQLWKLYTVMDSYGLFDKKLMKSMTRIMDKIHEATTDAGDIELTVFKE